MQYARRYYGSLSLTESALTHVFRHTKDDLSKSFHGIFNDVEDVVGIMDDAFKKVNSGVENVDFIVRSEVNTKITYVVDMERTIGTLGGVSGMGQDLNKLLIVLEKENGVITSRIVTAYPY